MLHVASGEIHEVATLDGYSGPDWNELPVKPAGPTEQWIWSGGAWKKNNELGYKILREKRAALLTKTDWTEYSRKLPSQKKAQWMAYRDQLFDLPANVTDPFNFQWPTPPE